MQRITKCTLLLSVLLISVGLISLLKIVNAQEGDDIYEENDILGTARVISPGYYTNLVQWDDDFYKLTAGKSLLLINSQREKIELLRKTGLDHLFILNFTREFSEISSNDFIRNILVARLKASKVVIGFNHHFGHNREGNFDYLYELGQYYGFGVEEIPEQDIHNETVSSTLIRKALLEGRIQRANAYLDHHYIIMGELREGSATCKQLNFRTLRINIDEENKLVPPDGVYAVNVMVDGEYYKGILNIKNSLPVEQRIIEEIMIDIHLFEVPVGLKGKPATVFFAKRIRDELQFTDQGQMIRQLESDITEVGELIY